MSQTVATLWTVSLEIQLDKIPKELALLKDTTVKNKTHSGRQVGGFQHGRVQARKQERGISLGSPAPWGLSHMVGYLEFFPL